MIDVSNERLQQIVIEGPEQIPIVELVAIASELLERRPPPKTHLVLMSEELTGMLRLHPSNPVTVAVQEVEETKWLRIVATRHECTGRRTSDATPHKRRGFKVPTVETSVSNRQRCPRCQGRGKRIRKNVDGKNLKVFYCHRCDAGQR